MTKFSIITCSYNYEKYIEETIESVINQTYQDWELIVIDDGSSDNSVEKIKKFCEKDNRIKLYTHKNNANKGLIKSIQLGLEKAQGEWISFLESDDIFKSNALSERVLAIEKYPDIKFFFNNIKLFGNDYRIKEFENSFKKSRKILERVIFPCNVLEVLKKRNIVPTFSSVTVKKSELIKCDFNCPVEALVDHFLWIQLARTNDFYYINKELTLWRMHPKSYLNSYKRNNIEKINMKIKINTILANHYKDKPFKKFCHNLIINKYKIKKKFLTRGCMKLGVSYNLFDGEELLEASIKSIRKEVDFISVIYQNISFRGEKASQNLYSYLISLKERGLVDEIYLYDRDFDKKEIKLFYEQEKRTIGLNLSKKHGCTHHLSMDVDEFYDAKQLKKAKEYILKKRIKNSAVPIIEYFKTPEYKFVNTYLYTENFGNEYTFYCPFIMKINKIFSQKYNNRWYPCNADPSRRLNNKKKFYLFGNQDIVMHHMSTVRKDVRKKFRNSNLMDGNNEVREQINNLKIKIQKWNFEDNQIENSKYAYFENKLIEKTTDKFEIENYLE